MSFEAVLVLAVLALVLALLIFTRVAADVILLGGLTLLICVPVPTADGWRAGLLDADAALRGFANTGLITVAVLFVVVTGLRTTGAADWIGQRALGRPKTVRGAVLRMLAPVCGMSAFLNNTPLVALMIPVVSDWGRRFRLSASKLMIPLSYAAILGGTLSLIGTSTNLVVSGLVLAHTDRAPIGIFDITWLGLPACVVGIGFLVLVGPRLLPDRGSSTEALANAREYIGEMLVPEHSPLAGQTIEQAGLRNLPGAYLVEIERGGEIIAAPGPDHVLHGGDRLVFAGVVDSIGELQRLRGLAPATNQVFKLDAPRYKRRLHEVVVSNVNPLVGKTIKEARFRTVYNAAVLAVARHGERVAGKIGEIRLRTGDMLLIEAAPSFEERHRDARDFFLVKPLENSEPRRHDKALLAIAILIAMVVAAALQWLTMLQAAMLAAGLMILTRCCSITESRRSVDWGVLLVIGAALGFGAALEQTGAAAAIAKGMIAAAGPNPWLALAAVYLATMITTEVITNNAAVALNFPIAQATAAQLGVSFDPFIFAMMMAGSASFATPLGYQTNMMVYGPGGYRFTDYFRIGIPMNLLMAAVAITLAPRIWPF